MNCDVSGGAKYRHSTSSSNHFSFGLVLYSIGASHTHDVTLGSALVLRSGLVVGSGFLRGVILLLC